MTQLLVTSDLSFKAHCTVSYKFVFQVRIQPTQKNKHQSVKVRSRRPEEISINQCKQKFVWSLPLAVANSCFIDLRKALNFELSNVPYALAHADDSVRNRGKNSNYIPRYGLENCCKRKLSIFSINFLPEKSKTKKCNFW